MGRPRKTKAVDLDLIAEPSTKMLIADEFKPFTSDGKVQYVSQVMDDILDANAASNVCITFYHHEVPGAGRVLTFKYRCTNPLEVPYILEVMDNLAMGGAKEIDSGRDY